MKILQTLGKYELIEKIGSGGMAEVYRARLQGIEGFQKECVVKKILPGYARNMSFIRMLVDEAKLTSVLQHPNIVQIFELGSQENVFYMAMEFVEGKDLLKILAKSAEKKQRPPVEIVCHIVAEICKGLHAAHNAKDINGHPLNIIHRDVSPSNIILGRGGHVKIMDFGVAKARTQEASGSRHVLRGKLGYMSPEQVRAEDIDHRSDLFSLGVVLSESLTLKRLFLGRTDLETLINIRDADIEKKLARYNFIPEGLADILRKALAKDRDERYADASEFQEAIDDFLYKNGFRIKNQDLDEFLVDLFGDDLYSRPDEDEDEDESPVAATAAGGVDHDEELRSGFGSSTSQGVKTFGATPGARDDDYLDEAGGDTTSPVVDEEETTTTRATDTGSATVVSTATTPVEPTPTPPLRPRPASPPPPPGNAFDQESSSPIVGKELTDYQQLMGHEFRFRNTTGYVFGPVDYENMINMVQNGAVSEEEEVSIDGGDWKKVREITSVRRISPAESLRTKGIRAIYSGTMSRLIIPKIFHQITSRRLSGKLRFHRGTAQKEFFFRKGKVVHIASNLKHEIVGSFLLRRGAVTQEQMRQALERAQEFGGRIGDTLVSLGIMSPYQLFELLDLQYREKFLQLFEWETGSYEFFEGVPSPVEMAPADATVYHFLVDGFRKHAAENELVEFLAAFKDAVVHMVPNRYLRVEDLPLNTREARVLNQLQKHPGVSHIQLAARDKDTLQLTRYLMVLLYQTELLQFKL
jgi:serine/threonine protein kinase